MTFRPVAGAHPTALHVWSSRAQRRRPLAWRSSGCICGGRSTCVSCTRSPAMGFSRGSSGQSWAWLSGGPCWFRVLVPATGGLFTFHMACRLSLTSSSSSETRPSPVLRAARLWLDDKSHHRILACVVSEELSTASLKAKRKKKPLPSQASSSSSLPPPCFAVNSATPQPQSSLSNLNNLHTEDSVLCDRVLFPSSCSVQLHRLRLTPGYRPAATGNTWSDPQSTLPHL
jgi:hypothetical protein